MMRDLIVIGGSYAGLSAALQLARAGRSVLTIDAGRPRNAVADRSHGYLAMDGIPPHEVIRIGREQLLAYPAATSLVDTVIKVERREDRFAVTTAGGRTETARRLLLAFGVTDVMPQIKGAMERWGKSLHVCPYCHGFEVSGRRLGVIASHVSSGPGAVMLRDWGPTIYFTQGVFEPDEQCTAWLAARAISIERTPIVEMMGTAPDLEAVRLADGRVIPVHATFTSTTYRLSSNIAEQLGCSIKPTPFGPVVEIQEAQTSVSGVFAAGDIAGDKQQISHAVSAGASAAIAIHRSLVLEEVQSIGR